MIRLTEILYLIIQRVSFNWLPMRLFNQHYKLLRTHCRCLFFTAGHAVNFRRIIYSAINIVYTKGEGELCILLPAYGMNGYG